MRHPLQPHLATFTAKPRPPNCGSGTPSQAVLVSVRPALNASFMMILRVHLDFFFFVPCISLIT